MTIGQEGVRPMNTHALLTVLSLQVYTPAPNPTGTTVVELLGAGGGLALIALIIKTIMDVAKGRADKQTTRSASLTTQRDTAWKERDEEREARRLAEAMAKCEGRNARKLWDYSAHLRRQMFLAGLEPKAQEPTLEQCENISLPPER